jgi:hypothetical protein
MHRANGTVLRRAMRLLALGLSVTVSVGSLWNAVGAAQELQSILDNTPSADSNRQESTITPISELTGDTSPTRKATITPVNALLGKSSQSKDLSSVPSKPSTAKLPASNTSEIMQEAQKPLVDHPENTVLEGKPLEATPEMRLKKAIEPPKRTAKANQVEKAVTLEKAPSSSTSAVNASGKSVPGHALTDNPSLIDTQAKPSVTELLKAQADAERKAKEAAAASDAAIKAEKAARKLAKKAKARPVAIMPEQKPLVLTPSAENAALGNLNALSGAGNTTKNTADDTSDSLSAGGGIHLKPAAALPAGSATMELDSSDQPSASPNSSVDFASSGTAAPASSALSEQAPASTPGSAQASPSEIPVVHKPINKWTALGNVLNPFYDETAVKPISYSPLPAIAVFPVIKHGKEKAFSDLPLLFAREYAERMEQKVPGTKVYNPVYTVDELRLKGLGHVYDKIMDYYKKAGRPEPTALDYLLKQISTDGKTISRVIFVEADLDMNQPDAATSLIERAQALLSDGTPKQMKYFVRSRLQIFDAETPSFPMVWAGSWDRSIKVDRFYNVTGSVYDESDSEQSFAKLSRQMSREILYVTPKDVYMIPVYDTSVQGKLATPAGTSKQEPVFPNFTESKPAESRISQENKQAIQRILQRQNSISP